MSSSLSFPVIETGALVSQSMKRIGAAATADVLTKDELRDVSAHSHTIHYAATTAPVAVTTGHIRIIDADIYSPCSGDIDIEAKAEGFVIDRAIPSTVPKGPELRWGPGFNLTTQQCSSYFQGSGLQVGKMRVYAIEAGKLKNLIMAYGYPRQTTGHHAVLIDADPVAVTGTTRFYLPRAEEIFNSLAAVKRECSEALAAVSQSLPRSVFAYLASRLEEVFAPEEWEGEPSLPSVASFTQLVTFLGTHNDLRAPAVTVTADGMFAATWVKDRTNSTRLQFDEDDWVKWLVLLAPIRGQKKSYQGTGTVPGDSVKSTLAPYHVWRWMAK